MIAALSGCEGFNDIASLSRSSYPQIIGHAGASGYVPESSLIGYDLAANMGADYSEPDLVLSSDNVFFAFHDLTLEGTTNVADLFPSSRQETFVIEGKAITGYYAVNFTAAEIKTLRIRQRFEDRSTLYNWAFPPPTLQDIIDWQINHYATSNRLVGIYPELKHPDFYNEIGYPMEELLVEQLEAGGYHVRPEDTETPRNLTQVVPVAIQCFKAGNLKYLSTITNVPLVQLVGVSEEKPTPLAVWNPVVLDEIATYAQAVSPDKKIFTTDWGTSFAEALKMMSWARDRGLEVVPWSFQQEQQYISDQFEGNAHREVQFYYGCLGVSGIFHEFPDYAREVVDACKAGGEETAESCRSQCREHYN